MEATHRAILSWAIVGLTAFCMCALPVALSSTVQAATIEELPASPDGEIMTVPRAGALPTIDGNVSEWSGLTPVLLNKDNASSISGEIPTYADLSAQLRGAWTPSALYFAASINDDVLVGNNSSQIWGDDVIELGIRVGSTTHMFTLAVDGRATDQGVPITSLTYMTRTVTGGWTLEVAIPPVALGLSSLSAGQSYAFTFGLWDDDLFTYPGQTHLIWQGTSVNTYQPAWGTLTFSASVYNFPLVPTTTPTVTPSRTPTVTPTITPSRTPTITPTVTPSRTPTITPTVTPSRTPTITPTNTPSTGRIEGKAFHDIDNDDIMDPGETGLSGAVLALKRNNVEAYTATSDATGLYRFSSVIPGQYQLVEKSAPPGYQPNATFTGPYLILQANQMLTFDVGHQLMFTPTATSTVTATSTQTATQTPTATVSATPLRTPTATRTPTVTRTRTLPSGPQPVYLPLALRQQSPTSTPTPTMPPVPDVPVLNPITPPEASSSYAIRWSPAARAESYVLERATGPGFSDAAQVYAGPVTQYIAPSQGIAVYHYRVKAWNGWGESGWSNAEAVEVRWEQEPNESTAEASGPLTAGKDYYGFPETIKDYYYFDTGSVGEIQVEVSDHNTLNGQVSLWYQSTELPDNRKATCQAVAGRCTLSYVGPEGRYYVQIYTADGYNTITPYKLRVLFLR